MKITRLETRQIGPDMVLCFDMEFVSLKGGGEWIREGK